MLVKCEPAINFINLIRTHFLYVFWHQKVSKPKQIFVIFGTKILYKKCMRKTLMKLTVALLLTNIFELVPNCVTQKLISHYSTSLARVHSFSSRHGTKMPHRDKAESSVNFINVLCATFSYKSALSSFSLITVWL